MQFDVQTATMCTCETSMKLGRAVEISPSVLMVQFTSWDRISQAASADSVQLSTCRHVHIQSR